MLFIPQKKPLTTKHVFKTSVGSFQIESKCFLYLKKSPSRQNTSSKHPLDHFKSSPNAFYTSKRAPHDKTSLQNIRWIISNRVQMLFIPQKKPLTTKSNIKTSVGSFQIESKCFLYLKKSPSRQNQSSKHPLDHFKSSPNAFYTSKQSPSRQNQSSKHPLDYFKSSPNAFNTSKHSPSRQNQSSKHPLDHFKSSPNAF